MVRHRAMATAESLSCRICCSFVSSTHCIALFSKDSKTSGLAERLSRVTDVPVVPKDHGLSQHICRPCNRKFQAAESLTALARASYEKSKPSRPLTGVIGSPKSSPSRPLTSVAGSPKSSCVMAPRKRSKDTSGVGVSPHTHQARPTAKRQTVWGLWKEALLSRPG